MTPFGHKIRTLRSMRKLTLKTMAKDIGVSSAYLSALEHGHRGRPGPGLVLQICGYFDLIWDEAEELKHLAALSLPRVTIDTGGLIPEATELANHMADRLPTLDRETIHKIKAMIVRQP